VELCQTEEVDPSIALSGVLEPVYPEAVA